MTDEQKQPSSAAERQRLYKGRQREAGFQLTANQGRKEPRQR